MNLLANILLLLFVPLLLSGWTAFIRGLWAGARGVSVFGIPVEFFRLFRRGAPSGKNIGILAEWGPAVSLVSVIFAGHLLPMAGGRAIVSVPGSLILFILFLWVKKFTDHLNSRALPADDKKATADKRAAGSADMMNSIVPLTLILGVFVLLGKNLSLDSVFAGWKLPAVALAAVKTLSGFSLLLLMVSVSVEPIPEASGADRAVYLYCRGFLQMIYGILAARAILPPVGGTGPSVALILGFLILLGALTGSAAFYFGKNNRKNRLTVLIRASVVLLAVVASAAALPVF